MFHIAIVEDDPQCLRQLVSLVEQIAAAHGVMITLHPFAAGTQLLAQYPQPLDLLLLDIQMQGMDGMTTAQAVRTRDAQVLLIFVTSMVQYAVEGYRVEAMDYLLKPVSYGLMEASLCRAFARLRARRPPPLVVKTAGGSSAVALEALDYAEAVNHRVTLHLRGETLLCAETLSGLEQKLAAYPFFRCHAAFLVALPAVQRIDGSDVFVAGARIPVSKHRRKAFLDCLAAYWGTQL